jgi:hypothetical protein
MDDRREIKEGFSKLLSEVEVENVDWLWQGYIPLGKMTIIDGDPGLGKSTAVLDIAARVSTGCEMPDGGPGIEPAGVVILSAEDGLADTIKPRLEVAGADCSKIVALTEIETSLIVRSQIPGMGSEKNSEGLRPPIIPDDLEIIAETIQHIEAKLLIVDPLMAFLSGDVASHRDQDVRRALHQVASLAEESGAAVLLIRHLNKSAGSNSTYRGGGSIGIIGAARSGLLVAKDPDDEERRIIAPVKTNLCKAPASLVFRLEDTGDVAKIVWEGVSEHNANSLLVTPSDEEGSALNEAKEILKDTLSDGAISASEVLKEARSAGISERTLRTAKKQLNVRSFKDGMTGGWLWELPKIANVPNALQPCSLQEKNSNLMVLSPGKNEDDHTFNEGCKGNLTKPQVDAEDVQGCKENNDGQLEENELIDYFKQEFDAETIEEVKNGEVD